MVDLGLYWVDMGLIQAALPEYAKYQSTAKASPRNTCSVRPPPQKLTSGETHMPRMTLGETVTKTGHSVKPANQIMTFVRNYNQQMSFGIYNKLRDVLEFQATASCSKLHTYRSVHYYVGHYSYYPRPLYCGQVWHPLKLKKRFGTFGEGPSRMLKPTTQILGLS